MAFSDTFLPELAHEMATTRTVLERVPMDRASWRPHPRSTSMGDLATHVAQLAGFAATIASTAEVDLQDGGGADAGPPDSTEALLSRFDANVAASRDAIRAMSESDLKELWSLKNGGKTVATRPRVEMIRAGMLKHMIHHRGQLTVYLRLNDVPVPPVYGPTADS